MARTQESLDRGKVLAGLCILAELTPQEGETLLPLVESAIGAVSGRLRNPELVPDSRLEYLTAVMAYYRLCLLDTGDGAALGNIRMDGGSARLEAAKKLLDEETASCKDLLLDEGFYFGQTGGADR